MTLTTLNLIAFTCGTLAAAFCTVGCWRLRDTTFGAPCAWAVVSMSALAAYTAWSASNAGTSELATAHLKYLAAITVVAPFVALLGAKRPQHIAWQWIVASLIALLAFQDLRSWLIEGSRPLPHAAWQWLLAAMLAMQVCNYLPTRYAAAAVMACIGQFCLLADSFSFLPNVPAWSFAAGVVMLSAAVLSAAFLSRRRAIFADVWLEAWFDFCDLFGALWGLRVCQRVNAVTLEQTSRLLMWHRISTSNAMYSTVPAEGFVADDAEPLQRSLRSVLTRFVSPAWLGSRGLGTRS